MASQDTSASELVALSTKLAELNKPSPMVAQLIEQIEQADRRFVEQFARIETPFTAIFRDIQANLQSFEDDLKKHSALALLTSEGLGVKKLLDLPRFEIPDLSLYYTSRLFDAETSKALANIFERTAFQAATLKDFSLLQTASVEIAPTLGSDSRVAKIISNETTLSGTLALSVSGKLDAEVEARAVPVIASTETLFRSKFPALGNELMKKWRGAGEVLQRGGSDCERQAGASLRELLKRTVERLTDEQAFEAWFVTTYPERAQGKRPLGDRIRFLMREKPVARGFIESDAESVVALLDSLNTAVHSPESTYDVQQMRYLYRRVEGFIAALLELRD